MTFAIADENLDYAVIKPSVIQVVPRGPTGFESIQVSFIRDGVSEMDETFALQLENNLEFFGGFPSGPGVFYRQILQFTIIDGDGKTEWLQLEYIVIIMN